MNKERVRKYIFDNILEAAGWVLLAGLWSAAIVNYLEAPDMVPIHFNFQGIITRWGRRITLLFFPVTATIMFTGLTLLIRHPGLFTKLKETNAALFYILRMIRWLKLSAAAVFVIFILFIRLSTVDYQDAWQPWIFPLVITIVVIPLSYYIYKILAHNKIKA